MWWIRSGGPQCLALDTMWHFEVVVGVEASGAHPVDGPLVAILVFHERRLPILANERRLVDVANERLSFATSLGPRSLAAAR